MCKLKFLFLIFVLLSGPLFLHAQDEEMRIELCAGDNVVFGGFAAVSITTVQTLYGNFSVNGGSGAS